MTPEQALTKFHSRPLSWSSISSFTFNKPSAKEKWYNNYILGKKEPPSEEMLFGASEGKKMELDPNYFPDVPRYGKDEYAFSVVYNGIKLVGYADSFCNKTFKKLGERKTGKRGTYEWTQKKCDTHGQIEMYLLMNFIQNKVRPDDVEIVLSWLPTKKCEDGNFQITISYDGDRQHFKTKRTMSQILKFASYITTVYKEMEKYIESKP